VQQVRRLGADQTLTPFIGEETLPAVEYGAVCGTGHGVYRLGMSAYLVVVMAISDGDEVATELQFISAGSAMCSCDRGWLIVASFLGRLRRLFRAARRRGSH
jgi:hypothetical protein